MLASSDTIVSSTRSRIPSCNSCKCSFELFTHVCRKYLIRGLTSLASIRSHYFPPLSPAHSCGTHSRGSWRVLLSSLSLFQMAKIALLTGRISSVSFCFCSSILLWVASALIVGPLTRCPTYADRFYRRTRCWKCSQGAHGIAGSQS